MTTFDGGAGKKWIKANETAPIVQTIVANTLNNFQRLNSITNTPRSPTRRSATLNGPLNLAYCDLCNPARLTNRRPWRPISPVTVSAPAYGAELRGNSVRRER